MFIIRRAALRVAVVASLSFSSLAIASPVPQHLPLPSVPSTITNCRINGDTITVTYAGNSVSLKKDSKILLAVCDDLHVVFLTQNVLYQYSTEMLISQVDGTVASSLRFDDKNVHFVGAGKFNDTTLWIISNNGDVGIVKISATGPAVSWQHQISDFRVMISTKKTATGFEVAYKDSGNKDQTTSFTFEDL
ncbi:MAG TPA: hypothetical protein VI912_05270 [Candidatus Bilamarchaeaceae archaeon]|nr:hypothetical protein [Candidatus Bilamarchaeaceae archaeon]